jgi:hypothetical protein
MLKVKVVPVGNVTTGAVVAVVAVAKRRPFTVAGLNDVKVLPVIETRLVTGQGCTSPCRAAVCSPYMKNQFAGPGSR